MLFSSLTAAGADLLLLYAPARNGWLHEEYHRSVMTLFYINSFNDMNTFPIGREQFQLILLMMQNLHP